MAFNGEPVAKIKAMLNADPSLVTKRFDVSGEFPISRAASAGRADVVRLLLERGADPNSVGQFDETPLGVAAFNNDVETGRVLLEYGADPTGLGMLGLTIAQLCDDEEHQEFRWLLDLHAHKPNTAQRKSP